MNDLRIGPSQRGLIAGSVSTTDARSGQRTSTGIQNSSDAVRVQISNRDTFSSSGGGDTGVALTFSVQGDNNESASEALERADSLIADAKKLSERLDEIDEGRERTDIRTRLEEIETELTEIAQSGVLNLNNSEGDAVVVDFTTPDLTGTSDDGLETLIKDTQAVLRGASQEVGILTVSNQSELAKSEVDTTPAAIQDSEEEADTEESQGISEFVSEQKVLRPEEEPTLAEEIVQATAIEGVVIEGN